MSDDPTADSQSTANSQPPANAQPALDDPPAPKASLRKVVVRIVLVVALLGVSGFVLVTAFDDLDWGEVNSAIRSLNGLETAAIAVLWFTWILTQGWQTASLIEGLSVGHGAAAFLGPASVASLVPGPSDLPVRFKMLRSWGISIEDATLSVAAGGIFSVGVKLVLPVVAAAGLVLSGAPIDGTLQTIVTIAGVVGIGLVATVVIFRSRNRTAAFARMIEAIWGAGLRALRRKPADPLEPRLMEARDQAVGVLRARGVMASLATAATSIARFGLFLMCLRFTGVPAEAAGWPAIFVAYAVVQGITVVPITAGDAGVSEVAYITFVTAATGSEYVNQVTAGVLLFRLLTWLLVIPTGLLVLAGWRLRTRSAAST